MKLKPILTALAVAVAAFVQPALAGFTQNEKGEVTHYNGIELPPMQTVEEARAQAQKEIAAAKKAREAQQAEQPATRHSTPATHPKDVFYTGKPYLEEAGQYLFLFRHYDPELARWTTADPSGFPDGANNYLHVNNWYGAIDDTGLQIIKIAYSTFIEDPYVTYRNRTFNGGEKTWQILTVDTVARSIATHTKGTGMTYEFDAPGGSVIDSGQSSGDTITASILGGASQCNFTVRMYGNEGNPLAPSWGPGITYQVDLNFDLRAGRLTFSGSHDQYPSHRLWIDDIVRYTFSHVLAGTDPGYLFPPNPNATFNNWINITVSNQCE